MKDDKEKVSQDQAEKISGGLDISSLFDDFEEGEKKAVFGKGRKKPHHIGEDNPDALF